MSTILLVNVQPGARRTEVVGWHGDAVKIRLAARPVDGAANDELVRFLAERLDTPRWTIRIVTGLSTRRKRVEVSAVGREQVLERLGLGPRGPCAGGG